MVIFLLVNFNLITSEIVVKFIASQLIIFYKILLIDIREKSTYLLN